MRSLFISPWFAGCVLASTAPVSAQVADIDAATDQTIVVTANRTARALSQVGESVAIIGEEEITRRQSTETLDILRTVPGLTFNRNGGIGGSAFVSIRGANTDQTVVLIDGVKLNDPASPGGGFDFGPLLTGNIARIEVVRGSQSVLYGSQAIGGVINMITRVPTDDLAVTGRAEYGERNSAQLIGNVSGRAGPAAISVGGGYARTDGISAFNAAGGGQEADGFESYGANAKVGVELTEALSVDLRGFYADSTTEIDGFGLGGFQDTLDESHRRDLVGYAGLNAAFLDGRFRNRIAFAYTNIDRLNVDGSGADTFEAEGENRRFEYQGVFDATSFAQLIFGAERETSEFRTVSFGGPASRANTSIDSAYAQLNLTPVTGLSLTGGVRHDDHETFGGETTFAASGAYTPNDGATVLRASYGEGFKAPSLFQLFSDFGNRTLTPETASTWDIGVRQNLLDGRAEIGITYFSRQARNQIVFASCFGVTDAICDNRPFGTYDNVDSASAEGVEIGLALRPVDGFDLSASYSLIDTQDDETGEPLARRPKHQLNMVADYAFDFGLKMGATVLHVGESFNGGFFNQRLDGYVVTDVRMAFQLKDGLELFGRVENVFDEEYETVFQYGSPGRTVLGGIRMAL
ncbi:TonB-dependent receptor [Pacificimonas sp. WHA3]|uniref:TonB-dependent receptor n=1 Tax=Pacificimonas pallii TaxID=2827236 RepID=A0ABS6SH86_9SPHN|nr:TonB-dependent receptor [Pacificimonas pallii]MBV7257779.1 TonB-dependent receptor [Pacificimonas pallii]